MATTELARSPYGAEPDRPVLAGWRLPRQLSADTGRGVTLSWLASRALTVALMGLWQQSVSGDVTYYARNLHLLFAGGGVRGVLQEYPLPVLSIMLPQYLLGALNEIAFTVLFGLSMLAVDALFTAVVWRSGGRRRTPALRFWLWFVPLLGPMAFFRFDLVTAVLAGCAVLAAGRRPALAGVLTAAGAALKLWPAVMLPIFLLRRGGRRAVLAGFAGAGLSVLVVSVLVGGGGRLLSPLRWQADRGLQIESVPALPLMIGHAIHPRGTWRVDISQYKAYEIFGAGVGAVTALTTWLTVAGLALLGWLWLRAYRRPAVGAETLGWMFLATASVVTITNKTLSPQYLLWLAGPLAALLLAAPGARLPRRAARLLLVVAVLTQVIYPTMYGYLLGVRSLTLSVTAVLALRDGLLVWLAFLACRQVYRQTRPAPSAKAAVATGAAAPAPEPR